MNPELDPPEQVVPSAVPSVFIGWRHSLGIDWRIDVVLARIYEGPSRYQWVPAAVVRPLLRMTLDRARVVDAYLRWEEQVVSANRLEVAASKTPVPNIEDLLWRPLAGPERTCEGLGEDDKYWDNHNALLRQAATLQSSGTSRGKQPIEEILEDYPFVVAALDHEKRLWDPETRIKPSSYDSVKRVQPASAPTAAHRNFALPNLAGELLALLPDGRQHRSKARDQATQVLGPLQSRWAFQTAGQFHQDETTCSEAADVREWIRTLRSVDPFDLVGIAHSLSKYVDNRRSAATKGQRIASGIYAPRLIEPYICPDLSVHPREAPGIGVPEHLADLRLVAWIRSDFFERMLEIVSGKDPTALRCRSSDSTLSGFLSERTLPFRRIRVRMAVGHPQHRIAVATVPGAQSDAPVDTQVTGFGKRDEILRRWLGTQVQAAQVDDMWTL